MQRSEIVHFRPEHFEPHVGTVFTLDIGGTAWEFALERFIRSRLSAREGGAFTLLLRHPSFDVVPPGIYLAEHPAIGAFDLYIEATLRDQNGMLYQATFN